MRGAPTTALSALSFVIALVGSAGCTSPGAPTDSKVRTRQYSVCIGAPEMPDQGTGEATFGAIYRDIISVHGAAKCQESGCHGGSEGQSGLSMGSDQKGAYCGLLCYQAILVKGDPAIYASCGCEDLVPGEDETTNADFLLQTVGYDPIDQQMSVGSMPNAACVDYDKSIAFPANRKLKPAEKKRIEAWAMNGAKNDGTSAATDSGVTDAAKSDASPATDGAGD